MATAIDRAEATKGKLPLTLKEGRKVSLQLRPLGPYSKTAPWNCKKTDAIITRVADQMLETKSFVGGQIPVGYIEVAVAFVPIRFSTARTLSLLSLASRRDPARLCPSRRRDNRSSSAQKSLTPSRQQELPAPSGTQC